MVAIDAVALQFVAESVAVWPIQIIFYQAGAGGIFFHIEPFIVQRFI